MAVVTSDLLASMTTQFSTDFWAARDRTMVADGWDKLCRMTTSATNQNTYGTFGSTPIMQDVTKKELITDSLIHYSYTLPNKTFKAGVPVKRAALEDDQFGEISEAIKAMGSESASHPGRLVWKLLTDGTSTSTSTASGAAFDGLAFFADTRVLGGSANIDNLAAGSGVTSANLITDLTTNRATMQRFQDDKGIVMNTIPNTIVCPPELVATFWVALNTDQTLAAAPMVPQGNQTGFSKAGYTVIGNALLTDTNDWYLLHIGEGSKKPFIYQERVKTTFESMTDPNSEMAIKLDEYLYSARGRYAVGFGDPRLAIKITN
jgi:phage major head subunit gpT-like protein